VSLTTAVHGSEVTPGLWCRAGHRDVAGRKMVDTWLSSDDSEDLAELFSRIGLGKYTDIFQQQEVNMIGEFLLCFLVSADFCSQLFSSSSVCDVVCILAAAFLADCDNNPSYYLTSLLLLPAGLWHFSFFNMSCLGVVLQVRGCDGMSTPQTVMSCLHRRMLRLHIRSLTYLPGWFPFAFLAVAEFSLKLSEENYRFLVVDVNHQLITIVA